MLCKNRHCQFDVTDFKRLIVRALVTFPSSTMENNLYTMAVISVVSILLAAISSTKNAKKECNSDAHQIKKGDQWNFGFKGHIDVGKDIELVNELQTNVANVNDVIYATDLMESTEEVCCGDSGYLGIDHR